MLFGKIAPNFVRSEVSLKKVIAVKIYPNLRRKIHILKKLYSEIDDWNLIRADIIIRDDYTCQMCKSYFGSYNLLALSVHHIMPRDKGGSNDERNLITLCQHCHDIAEEKELSYKEIKNYYKKFMDVIKIKRPPKIAYLWKEFWNSNS
jgi:5-methylcytosine-specific restriction endonuclease McrA